ncbi:MAG: hypothetical protein PHO00_00425 [bacterium]|nr:hypothetical protein [bacterium]
MKKLLVFVFVTAVVFMFSADAAAARKHDKTLTEFVERLEVCRVYVADFDNSSGNPDAAPSVQKQMLINAMQRRTTQNFMVVDNPAEADVIIKADIKKFLYSEEDPVYDGIVGVGMTPVNPVGLAMDIALTQHYVENEIAYDITDHKGRKLWNGSVNSNVTKSDMPLSDAVELVGERSARNLFLKCFKKHR